MPKKIISAIGNNDIIAELEKEKYEITGDVFTQEILFELLKNEYYDFLIISSEIKGIHDRYSLIKQLKDINSEINIILIIPEEDKKYKEYLLSKNIKNVFINEKSNIKNILDLIKKNDKNINFNSFDSVNSMMANIENQEIITVAGTEGSGKSTILVNLASFLAEKSIAKILIIDLDTIDGNINTFFDIMPNPDGFNYQLPQDKNTSLNYLVDFIDKKMFDTDIFEKSLIKIKRSENLYLLSGNTSLHICKNVLSYEHYNKILEKAKQQYDFIFIDTSSNIFLDSTQFALNCANKILFVTEADKKCIGKSQRIFNDVYRAWGINENKFEIIINKLSKCSIDKTIVKEIFNNYKIAYFINYDEKYVKHLNMGRPYIIDNECYEYENILEEFNYIKRKKLKEKIASGKLFDFTI